MVNIAKGLLKMVKLVCQTHWNVRGLQKIGGRYLKGSNFSNKTASEKQHILRLRITRIRKGKN